MQRTLSRFHSVLLLSAFALGTAAAQQPSSRQPAAQDPASAVAHPLVRRRRVEAAARAAARVDARPRGPVAGGAAAGCGFVGGDAGRGAGVPADTEAEHALFAGRRRCWSQCGGAAVYLGSRR
ncbi:MAG: hypothetical protein U1E73_14170 [Planctomycetota bacterium]